MAPPPPCRFRVTLPDGKPKQRWPHLVMLEVHPSRYPDPHALEVMGIADCFWELSDEAGLTQIFRVQHNSYRCLTLEFLCTLELRKVRRKVESISFRLMNEEYELTVQELNDILGFKHEDVSLIEEPEEYNPNQFWSTITLPPDAYVVFDASKAKNSLIRNPVLRILQRCCSNLVLAKKEGGITTEELFMLWNVLHRQSVNLGYYLTKYLNRQATKKAGRLGCGGIIPAIALSRGLNLERLVPNIGPKFLDLDYFRHSGVIFQDAFLRTYFKQRAGDHFPYRDPANTYVQGWGFRTNWRMKKDVHKAIIGENPAQSPPINSGRMPGRVEDLPYPEVASSPPSIPLPQPANPDIPESSRRRRRRREPEAQAEDRDATGLHVHMDDFERIIGATNASTTAPVLSGGSVHAIPSISRREV